MDQNSQDQKNNKNVQGKANQQETKGKEQKEKKQQQEQQPKEQITQIIVGVVALIAIIFGLFYFNNQNKQENQDAEITEEAAATEEGTEEGMAEEQPADLKDASTYTVQEGDNLWMISERKYGSGYNYVDVVAANQLMNPDAIAVGQEITLPNVETKQPTSGDVSAASTEEVKQNMTEYTTQEGDSLYMIAQKVYGDGDAWMPIAQANNIDNPHLIDTGMNLTIPQQ